MKREKNKIYEGRPGEAIKIVVEGIQKKLNKKTKPKRKYQRIEKLKTGKFKNSDLKYMISALEFLEIVGESGFEKILESFQNQEGITKTQAKAIAALQLSRGPIFDFLDMYKENVRETYNTSREIASLEGMYDIIKNSRDGIITKEQIRKEKDENGNEIEIKSDVAMSEGEILETLVGYQRRLNELKDRQFVDYLGLGMSVVNLLRYDE